MRIYYPLFLVFFLASIGTVQADLNSKLNELKGLILDIPMDQDDKDRFSDYIDMIRDNPGFAHFATVGHLLDALLIQLSSMALNEEILASGSQPLAQDPMDEVVDKVDEIKSEELFFKVNKSDLVFLPSETYYMGSMSCSVQIFARDLGPIMFDPGGVLHRGFAESVELMAVAIEGGAFTWEWDQDNDNTFYSEGDRAYFRMTEYETASVRVTLESEFGTRCQSVLRVTLEGGFPSFGGN